MPETSDNRRPGYIRLAVSNDGGQAVGAAHDADLAACISQAVQAMERLVAAVTHPASPTEARRLAIELALTRLDEQLMLATHAHLACPSTRAASGPSLAR